MTPVTEEAQPCQRGETEGGDPRERSPLLRLRVHEGEPLPADEGQVRREPDFKNTDCQNNTPPSTPLETCVILPNALTFFMLIKFKKMLSILMFAEENISRSQRFET